MSDTPISWLPVPGPDELSPEARALHEKLLEKVGFVPNVFAAWSLRPDHLLRWKAHYDLVMRGPSGLSVAQREMIAVLVSALNGCYYCSTSHGAALRLESGDPALAAELAVNWRHAPLAPLDRAILEYAEKLTRTPSAVGLADLEGLRSAGLDPETTFDVAEVAAMFNFTNRLANATGVRPNPEYHGLGR